MALDPDVAALADRLRPLLEGEPLLGERSMFGGHAFLVGGHLAISASGRGGLLVRCDPAATDVHVAEPGVERFEMRGRAMDGWLAVEADASTPDERLRHWVEVGTSYAAAQPPKAP